MELKINHYCVASVWGIHHTWEQLLCRCRGTGNGKTESKAKHHIYRIVQLLSL